MHFSYLVFLYCTCLHATCKADVGYQDIQQEQAIAPGESTIPKGTKYTV